MELNAEDLTQHVARVPTSSHPEQAQSFVKSLAGAAS
jgi:hypothetical protein